MNKPGTFPLGTQRIARISEVCEPNTYVLEPAAEAAEIAEPAIPAIVISTPLTDAELASAFVDGEAPVVLRRAARMTGAYTAKAVVERPDLTVA